MLSSQPSKSGASASTKSTSGNEHVQPGSIIFAKMKSFPPWPAKVVSADNYPGTVPKNQIAVLFLGSGEYGHVPIKDTYRYAEFRDQFGSPKKQPKFAEAIRAADEMVSGRQTSGKREAPKPSEKEKTESELAGPSPAKRPRGRPPQRSKSGSDQQPSAEKPDQPRHEEEMLPASQLAEIAASTVFEPDLEHQQQPTEDAAKSGSPLRPTAEPEDDYDDEDADEAISNVVRQLEELEKQEEDERMRTQSQPLSTSNMASSGSLSSSQPSTAPKRRGRPPRKPQPMESTTSAAGTSGLVRPTTLVTEHAKDTPSRISRRSLSETTDDGRAALGSQSSGSETPVSGGESSALGKRRHKPKIMSEYFLEYDYSSPRGRRKSESSPVAAVATPTTPASQPAKTHQPKTPKPMSIERHGRTPSSGRGGKKSTPVGSRSTKDMEKASLEAEIARVKMAAEQNQGEHQHHHHASDQLWQRHEAFADLPFDDSMFEMTVDVEESPSANAATTSYGGESMSYSQAAAKRRKDANEMVKERERERMKQKEKLKVKLLKGPLPAPKIIAAAVDGKKKKKGKAAASLIAAKKKAVANKMKVKLAKKKATKAAKVVAAAEVKIKKKRGRKPSLIKKPKPPKRITGYGMWAEREMGAIRRQHPEVKGLQAVRDLLQARWDQLSDSEKMTWQIMAKREKEKRKMQQPQQQPGTPVKRGPGRPPLHKSPASATTSPAISGPPQPLFRQTSGIPSSPRGSRLFIMSPLHETTSSMDIGHQQQQMAFVQSPGMVEHHQIIDSGTALAQMSPYDLGGGVSTQPSPMQQQAYSQAVMQPSPVKRPRGRPPKHPRPSDQHQSSLPQPQIRPTQSSVQQRQTTQPLFAYQAAPLPKGLRIPKKESAAARNQSQSKPPLKILTAGQRRAPFQGRSPQPMMQPQEQQLLQGTMDEPPVPDAMAHEELVYDSEAAAIAAAEAAGMDLGAAGLITDEGVVVEDVGYGHMEEQHRMHPELREETAAAVSYLTGDETPTPSGVSTKPKGMSAEERAAKKREASRLSRAKKRESKSPQKKGDQTPGTPQTPNRQQKQTAAQNIAPQFAMDQDVYGQSSAVAPPAAAFEVAFAEPLPSEEETNMFFFGTTQDVQALLEVRNPPGPLESQCRWWLKEDEDPELRGKKAGRGESPPRALTAEPLDAAAVFKLIGRTFENIGNHLMREEGEDAPHEIAGGMDMLLDALVSSMGHLLTLTGSIPPFDRRYRRDQMARLVEETSMMIPI